MTPDQIAFLILAYLIEHNHDELHDISFEELPRLLNLSNDDFDRGEGYLREKGLIGCTFTKCWYTALGVDHYQSKNEIQKTGRSIYIGNYINNSTLSGNIQGVGSATNSSIEQASHDDIEKLKNEIGNICEKILSTVIPELNLCQQDAYRKIVKQFEVEVSKPKPDPTTLQKLLSAIGFFADVEGVIEFSSTMIGVMRKFCP